MFKKLIFLIISFSLHISCSPSSSSGRDPASEITDGLEENQLRIFISSSTHDGNLGGKTGANEICDDLAKVAGLERKYKAIISTPTSPIVDSLNEDGEIYIFISEEEKVLVAKNLSEFFDSDNFNLNQKINYDENYNLVEDFVWTATNGDGSADEASHCENWTSSLAESDGLYGNSAAVNSVFLNDAFESCTELNHIYCISQ
jgi:hypothetical protein